MDECEIECLEKKEREKEHLTDVGGGERGAEEVEGGESDVDKIMQGK